MVFARIASRRISGFFDFAALLSFPVPIFLSSDIPNSRWSLPLLPPGWKPLVFFAIFHSLVVLLLVNTHTLQYVLRLLFLRLEGELSQVSLLQALIP